MIIWTMLPELWSVADIMFCHFGSFFALIPYYLPRKSNFGKNVKKPWTHYPFTYVYNNWRSYDVWFLTYKARQSFCHFGSSFALWTSEQFKKSKFWKNQYNTWRYYHFTLVYHKWQSYGVWFLRYGAQQTEFFVILDNFLPFYRTYNWKNKNFEKTKTILGDIIILHMCNMNKNHDVWFLRHWAWQTDLFLIFDHFLPFYHSPPNNPENQNFEKIKKQLEISFHISVP